MEEEIKILKDQGFTGFYTIGDLRNSTDLIPDVRGVYVIIRPIKKDPIFLEKGCGGFFKGKDPNVEINILREKWNNNSSILYIGKAGDPGSGSTLKKRIKQYLNFGLGKNVGHYGGRYIWQLADSSELIVAWKPLPDGFPSQVEYEMLEDFSSSHNGKLPFANLTK